MLDTNSPWYNTKKDPKATVLGGMVPLAIIDEKNYQKFLEPGNPRIWDDQSNPMDTMGRAGLFLSLLKEGIPTHLPSLQNTKPILRAGKITSLLTNTLTPSTPQPENKSIRLPRQPPSLLLRTHNQHPRLCRQHNPCRRLSRAQSRAGQTRYRERARYCGGSGSWPYA
jgi:hypothetical protein